MVDAAIAWLHTAEAKHAARRALAYHRLPSSLVDDLLQETAVRLLRSAAARDDTPIVDAEAFVHRMLQRAAQDLHRYERRRPVEAAETLPEPARGRDDNAHLARVVEDEYRRVAQASLVGAPWKGAAVLNELTFHLHAVPVPVGVPTPGSGDTDGDVRWAALWLAGMRDCFARDGRPEDAAMRKRRARALDAVRTELRRVVEIVEAGAHG